MRLFRFTALFFCTLLLIACAGGGGGGGAPSNPSPADAAPPQAVSPNLKQNSFAQLSSKASASGLHSDVAQAWYDGYTGANQRITVVDTFSSDPTHGNRVGAVASSVATGATIVSSDYPSVLRAATIGANSTIVNYSFGIFDQSNINGQLTPNAAQTLAVNTATGLQNFAGNNVIVKSAGNYSAPLGQTITATMRNNPQTIYYDSPDRLNEALKNANNVIFAGASDKHCVANQSCPLASYSSTPGSDVAYQNRFLFTGVLAEQNGGNRGTSFAAPIIAGYAAILREKFPNLDAQTTTSRLLTTGNKNFLGYDVAIHGQGEASLARALAPAGVLR